MATLPSKRSVCGVAAALGLAGAVIVGLSPMESPTASADGFFGIAAVDGPPPPPPDPVPIIDRPRLPGSDNEAQQPRNHHHYGDPIPHQ